MPEDSIFHILLHHWKIVLGLWMLSNIIAAMPSPNGGRVTSSWLYKWAFGTLHGAFGMLPRMFAVLFPLVIGRVSPMASNMMGLPSGVTLTPPTAPDPAAQLEKAKSAAGQVS